MDRLEHKARLYASWKSRASRGGKVIARSLLIERQRTKRLRAELDEAERRGFQLAIAALRGEPCRPHITAAWWLEGVEQRKWGKVDK